MGYKTWQMTVRGMAKTHQYPETCPNFTSTFILHDGYLNFSAWVMKNVITQTEEDKIMK
jgi:hypothetical protein